MKIKLLLLGSAFCFSGAYAQMNGTYTVNSGQAASATNYANVASAVSDLTSGVRSDGGPINGPGVSGNVVIRLAAGSGPYTEQVNFTAIPGASLLSTVRLTGGPTMEEINFLNTTTTDRHVVRLTGASYIQLDSLTLVNNGITYGYGVHLTTGSDYNAISNCDITVLNTSTSSNFAGVVISGSTPTTVGDHGDYNVISNNGIHGGYYGISINGTSSTVRAQSNYIGGNTVDDFYYYGIRNYMQNASVLEDNTIEARATGTTAGFAIYNYYSDNYSIQRNNISRFGGYGIYNLYNNTLSGSGLIANNFIGGASLSIGSPYGIYCSTSAQNINIYHNNISLTSGNGRGIYILAGTGNNVVNNSISYRNSTTGYALYVSQTTYVNTVDFNNYYVPGSSNFVYLGTAYTPGTIVGGGGYNTGSINVDPGYIDPVSDLHIGFYANLWDMGTNVGVNDDFDGEVRPMAPTALYDIGADEHTPDSVNIFSLSLLDVSEGICPDSNQYIGLVYASGGINTLYNIPFTLNLTGGASYNQTVYVPGPITSGQVDTVWFGPINTNPGGAMSITAYADYINDQDRENDSLYLDFNIQILPVEPVAMSNTVCEGADVYAQVVDDGFAHIWYDGNGNVISYEDSVLIPSIANTTTLWAANASLTSASLTTTFANNNSCGGGNMFRVTALNSSILIDSFDLHSSSTAAYNVSIYYMAGDYVGNETNAGAWTLWEDVPVTGAGTGFPTPCGLTNALEIPAGQTYSIYIYNTGTVYTNGAGNFSNADLLIEDGTGLCGLFSGTNYPRTWNGTIHYRKYSCPSNAVPVTITAVTQPMVDLGLGIVQCGDVTLDGTTAGATDYSWSTGGTSAMESIPAPFSGEVILTASNMYCAPSVDTVDVTAIQLPGVDLGNDTYFCAGGNVVLNGTSGTAGVTYLWNTLATTPTITVTSAGTYSVTVTDPGTSCTNADTVMVDEIFAPTADFSGGQTTGSTWQFNDLTLGAPTSWSWDFGDGVGTSTLQNPSYTYTAAGTYTVVLTVTNDCGTSIDSMSIEILGLDEVEFGQMAVFPNPTQGFVYGTLNAQGAAQVVVTDMRGRIVQEATVASEGGILVLADLNTLETGSYLITVKMDQQVYQSRVVKQ